MVLSSRHAEHSMYNINVLFAKLCTILIDMETLCCWSLMKISEWLFHLKECKFSLTFLQCFRNNAKFQGDDPSQRCDNRSLRCVAPRCLLITPLARVHTNLWGFLHCFYFGLSRHLIVFLFAFLMLCFFCSGSHVYMPLLDFLGAFKLKWLHKIRYFLFTHKNNKHVSSVTFFLAQKTTFKNLFWH